MSKRPLFLDLETTGLKPEDGAVILSIGAVADVGTPKKGKQLSYFYGVVCPTEKEFERADKQALEVNGMTYDYLKENGKPFNQVVDDFVEWLYVNTIHSKRYTVVGQYPPFDLHFLTHFMFRELTFVDFPFDEPIDIRDLYSILVNRGKAPFLKKRDGHSISRALGVEEEPKVHNALEGAKVVMRNYEKIVELGVSPLP